ncbi:MAG: MnhB domain-containing protein [Phycisphaerales bacterium]
MTITSSILQTAMRLIFPLSILFAFFMGLKGHNAPGGGFIAGLIAAVAILTYRMSYGPNALLRLMPVHPRVPVAIGLVLAGATGLAPMLFGKAFLTSYVGEIPLPFTTDTVHYSTAVFFDAGVLLVVVGVAVGMIQRLSEELE